MNKIKKISIYFLIFTMIFSTFNVQGFADEINLIKNETITIPVKIFKDNTYLEEDNKDLTTIKISGKLPKKAQCKAYKVNDDKIVFEASSFSIYVVNNKVEKSVNPGYSILSRLIPSTGDDGYKELHISLLTLLGVVILLILGRRKKKK